MRLRTSTLLAVLALATSASSVASAATPYADIASPGPLTHVFVGNDLSCQVGYEGDAAWELYPPTDIPGDCGTFVAIGGRVFSPDFSNHQSTATRRVGGTPYTPLAQTGPTGTGTKTDPFKVVTEAALPGTALRIRQTDTYVAGDLTFRTDVEIVNAGAAQRLILYRAGDCYLQESDYGYSFVRAGKSIGCSRNPDNFPPARVEQWVPITTAGANYYDARFSEVWQRIGAGKPFADLCRCLHAVDNGGGVSWKVDVPANGTVTRSHYTTFSKNGISGTPGSADRTPPDVYISTHGKPLRRLKCVPASFNARVNALDVSPLLRVTIRLDGRLKLRTKNSLSNVPIRVPNVHGARHVIDVVAKDTHGNESDTKARFKVC